MWLYSSHIYMLTEELSSILTGKRINEVFIDRQSRKVLFSIGRPSDKIVLQFTPSNKACRLNLIDSRSAPKKSNLSSIPAPLRKCRIDGCIQINFDRIIRFDLINKAQDKLLLHFILIPSAPNIIVSLSDSKTVKWALTKNKIFKNNNLSFPPVPSLLPPYQVNKDYFLQLIDRNPETTTLDLLYKHIRGIDPQTAIKILSALSIDTHSPLAQMHKTRSNDLITFLRQMPGILNRASMAIKYKENFPTELYINLPGVYPEINTKVFKSPSEAIEKIGGYIDDNLLFWDRKNALCNLLKREAKKVNILIKELTAAHDDYKDYLRYRKFGDLLLINPGIPTSGKKAIKVYDVFDKNEPQITIPIKPDKNIPDNAALYYKKHRKAKRGLELIIKRLNSSTEHKTEIEGYLSRADRATNIGVLEEIDKQCRVSGIITAGPEQKYSKKGKRVYEKIFKEYELANGIKLFVGRNNRENEELTFRFASKNDLWFHAQQSRGSHVILKRPNKNYQFPKLLILKAASTAAYFSKARSSSSIPVVYTEVKYVRKARGALPGKVVYSNEKSIFVSPEEPD